MTPELRWRASPLAKVLLTCAALALAAAVAGRWQLLVFAAPLLGVLCAVSWQRPASAVDVAAEPASERCFEGETVRFTVRASARSPVALRVVGVDGLDATLRDDGTTVDMSAQRWGRYPLRVQVEMVSAGGLFTGVAVVDAAELTVYPMAAPQPTALPRTDLPDRLGTHLTRHVGPGVEYADIRSYVPGDPLRTVNWSVSARRGSLHVTERLTDRAADVVVLVDGSAQPPGPATDATERMVHGAVQVVQTALRNGDRAGIVALGGSRPRWIGADIGRRQFYRVLDTVLDASGTFETTTGTLAPRAAVPPGAIVIGFSTLLDTAFALALIDLRTRGHVVVAVDVLEGFPLPEQADPLVARMWSLQRSFMYRDMATVGVDVVAWQSDSGLDQAMHVLPDRRRRYVR
ncbi:DUF58 domain-containing protein [Mycobacterium sp. MYCO198283]|uniref:DUF58 domain-containing protein n=1 Tax=Mycobacterium sp. MYCO198283 TaxID=2883505 RepID=UPI001E5FAC6D|nr:DUF58 domain-containing protein [Mycobacterium sp. MYCO198283]MCG5432826.1 DUF58 domain-containing protein [Mycobacterium sp. MYCO198283]